MKKKILIIGGAGFIGHNLALSLSKEKYQVKILDSLSVNNLKTIKKSKFYPNPKLYKLIVKERLKLLRKKKIKLNFVNAQSLNSLSNFFKKYQPNVVVHLAAVSHANKSNDNPNFAYENSLTTLKNSLIASVKTKVNHFIFLSSSMVYGNFKKNSVNENTLCNPVGVYGNLKFAAEFLIKSFKQTYNLDYTILRPSALYGERCISRRVGQIFIENAISNKDLNIDGDGSDLLDFTYIQDLVAGIIKIIENKNSINNTFNITFGSARKISDLIDILKISFPNININYKKRDKLMPHRGTLSIDKAKDLIGYEPSWPIEKGYSQYIDWYKNFKKYN